MVINIFSTIQLFSMLSGVGDVDYKRLQKIESQIREFGLYQPLYEGIPIRGKAFALIKEVDAIVDSYDDSYAGGTHEIVLAAIRKVFEHMEEEMERVGIVPPVARIPEKEGEAKWEWDPQRRSWYYWSQADGVSKFHNGVWVKPDGTQTSAAQEAAKRRAEVEAKMTGLPPPPREEDGDTEQIASGVQGLSTGGEDDWEKPSSEEHHVQRER